MPEDFSKHVTWLAQGWLDSDPNVADLARSAFSEAGLEGQLRDYVKRTAALVIVNSDIPVSAIQFTSDALDTSVGEIDFTALAKRYWDKQEPYRARERKGFTS